MKWFNIPLVIMGTLFIIAGLSYKGVLPFDFNTVRGYTAIGICASICVPMWYIGFRYHWPPKKGETEDG